MHKPYSAQGRARVSQSRTFWWCFAFHYTFATTLLGRASKCCSQVKTYAVRKPTGVSMTHVVTEACFKCTPRRCVVVCPVDCFHEGDQFVVIDPDRCIDCAECVIECPVEAIYEGRHMPSGQQHFSTFNAEMARNWPLLQMSPLEPQQQDKA